MTRIIGYEGSRSGRGMTYGAAAIERNDGSIYNSATWHPGCTRAKFEQLVQGGAASLLSEPIEVKDEDSCQHMYIVDLPTERWERDPYFIQKIWRRNVQAYDQGERTVLRFPSLERLTQWLTNMHFRPGYVMEREGEIGRLEGEILLLKHKNEGLKNELRGMEQRLENVQALRNEDWGR